MDSPIWKMKDLLEIHFQHFLSSWTFQFCQFPCHSGNGKFYNSSTQFSKSLLPFYLGTILEGIPCTPALLLIRTSQLHNSFHILSRVSSCSWRFSVSHSCCHMSLQSMENSEECILTLTIVLLHSDTEHLYEDVENVFPPCSIGFLFLIISLFFPLGNISRLGFDKTFMVQQHFLKTSFGH